MKKLIFKRVYYCPSPTLDHRASTGWIWDWKPPVQTQQGPLQITAHQDSVFWRSVATDVTVRIWSTILDHYSDSQTSSFCTGFQGVQPGLEVPWSIMLPGAGNYRSDYHRKLWSWQSTMMC